MAIHLMLYCQEKTWQGTTALIYWWRGSGSQRLKGAAPPIWERPTSRWARCSRVRLIFQKRRSKESNEVIPFLTLILSKKLKITSKAWSSKRQVLSNNCIISSIFQWLRQHSCLNLGRTSAKRPKWSTWSRTALKRKCKGSSKQSSCTTSKSAKESSLTITAVRITARKAASKSSSLAQSAWWVIATSIIQSKRRLTHGRSILVTHLWCSISWTAWWLPGLVSWAPIKLKTEASYRIDEALTRWVLLTGGVTGAIATKQGARWAAQSITCHSLEAHQTWATCPWYQRALLHQQLFHGGLHRTSTRLLMTHHSTLSIMGARKAVLFLKSHPTSQAVTQAS